MGPYKGRRSRKIEISTDVPTEFELGDTATDIQRKGGGGRREREDEAQKQRGERQKEEARREETTHLDTLDEQTL